MTDDTEPELTDLAKLHTRELEALEHKANEHVDELQEKKGLLTFNVGELKAAIVNAYIKGYIHRKKVEERV